MPVSDQDVEVAAIFHTNHQRDVVINKALNHRPKVSEALEAPSVADCCGYGAGVIQATTKLIRNIGQADLLLVVAPADAGTVF